MTATWTFCGHWDNDSIVVDYVVPGEVPDTRVDTGAYPEGLWAASASGATMGEAEATARAEYEGAPTPDPVTHEIVYAYSPEHPVEAADRWFAQTGGTWMAVAPWESEDDWFAETDPADIANPRVLPIDMRPSGGVLIYRKADGMEVYEGRGTVEAAPAPAPAPDELNRLLDALIEAREGDSNDDEIEAYRDALGEALSRLDHPRMGEV